MAENMKDGFINPDITRDIKTEKMLELTEGNHDCGGAGEA